MRSEINDSCDLTADHGEQITAWLSSLSTASRICSVFPVSRLRDCWKPAIWFVSSQYMSGPISFFIIERTGSYGRGLAFAHAVYDLFSRWICETFLFILIFTHLLSCRTALFLYYRCSSDIRLGTLQGFSTFYCASRVIWEHTSQVVSTVCTVKVLRWKLLLVSQVFGATRH